MHVIGALQKSKARRSSEEVATPATLSSNKVFCDLLRKSIIQEGDACDLEGSSGSAPGDDKCVTQERHLKTVRPT
jgi:hypothetical protein